MVVVFCLYLLNFYSGIKSVYNSELLLFNVNSFTCDMDLQMVTLISPEYCYYNGNAKFVVRKF